MLVGLRECFSCLSLPNFQPFLVALVLEILERKYSCRSIPHGKPAPSDPSPTPDKLLRETHAGHEAGSGLLRISYITNHVTEGKVASAYVFGTVFAVPHRN